MDYDDGIPADVKAAEQLLPAWFVPRMMMDSWLFGLALVNGDILAIDQIDAVRLGMNEEIWLDVTLSTQRFSSFERRNLFGEELAGRVVFAPTSRAEASINARHILYALELGDS